jgi:hypothetical protein
MCLSVTIHGDRVSAHHLDPTGPTAPAAPAARAIRALTYFGRRQSGNDHLVGSSHDRPGRADQIALHSRPV